ncbi:DUF6029 family protein [Lewinella cohaerens]|uniref:DUF6029 family protein n=1 Tax=Lewinella cohaerens TaxID=70995 RepID=UPI00037140E4|nr:DUF6029 family protein [Lewinella cohaerens]
MKCYAYIIVILGSLWVSSTLSAQEQGGRLSGSLETNANFFVRDSLIGAANTPQYDRQLFGSEGWLNLNYSNWGFDIGLRYDFFNNSNLLNPTGSYTDQGIGMWYVRKRIKKLGFEAGYIYDQVGSGIIFRSFEQRPLLIDNALYGLKVDYQLSDNWNIKGFTGRQKQQFDTYSSVIRGLNIEGYVQGDSLGTWSLAPGFGVVARTLDDASMNSLVATLNTYPTEDLFIPNYNSYAFTLYNTLSAGIFSWYVEGAYKTEDAMNDPFGEIQRGDNITIGDKFISEAGTVLYSSLSIAPPKWGITLEAKRTENFSFRTRPQSQLNRGLINFLPPMARINTYRLTARYNAATQDLAELAYQVDVSYAPNRKVSFNANYSHIDDLDGVKLYREVFTEVQYKHKKLWKLTSGVQVQNYNQERYEFKPQAPIVETVIPYFDFVYKLDRSHNVRFEGQYMLTGDDEKAGAKQDYGDWVFGLIEVSLGRNWTLTASDMFNIDPGKNSPVDDSGEKQSLHYPRFDVYYTTGPTRLALSYVKQVEGVVCTGGICRLEPAFSGVKFSANTSF